MALESPEIETRTHDGESFYGWFLVAIGTAIIVIVNGTFYSFGVFFKPLLSEFGWTRAELSGAVSLRLMATGLFGILGGAIADKLGAKWIVALGVALLGLGYFLTSTVQNLWEMYLYLGLISGIGMSVPYPAITSVVSRWFTRKRGLATGIILSGYGIGQILFPPLTAYLLPIFLWRKTFIILGMIILFIAVPVSLFLKPPSAPKKSSVPAGSTGPTPLSKGDDIPWTMKEAVRSLPLWKISMIYLLFSISLQTVVVHLVPHATDIGIEPVSAALLLTIIGGCNAFGRITGGGISDIIGTKRALTISIIAPALMLPAFMFISNIYWLYVVAVLYGLGYGGLSAAVPKLASEYYGLHSLGTLLGIIQLGFAIGGAIGAPLTGYIFDVTNSYSPAFFLVAFLLVICFFIATSLRPPEKRKY
ncbi:MAG: MFS transporter [Dehalococcoidia bacterium]|nr:MFS transporter [Dehalococcoidia bacterium]